MQRKRKVDNEFEQEVINEISNESDSDFRNPFDSRAHEERVGGFIKPKETPAVHSNVKYLSQLVKLDQDEVEVDLDVDAIRGINLPASIGNKPLLQKRNENFTNRVTEPLDFEKVFIVGYNENICLEKD